MKRVLITGASGFIGNHVGQHMLKEGFDVVGIDCIRSEGGFPVECFNMLDDVAFTNSLDKLSPDIIVHCAGSADVSKSVRNPYDDFRGNVVLTHNLLFAMHELGMQKTRLVFLSSAGVYGNPSRLPITEEMPLKPMSPYAVHKVMCEELCMYFVDNYGMDIKIARIFSAYGKGLRKQILWDLYQKYRLTGILNVLGTGNESRDYIHIKDLSRALQILVTTDSEDNVYNVANGKEITIRCVAECLADILGIPRELISFSGHVREGDPLNWQADIRKIQKLGYIQTIDIRKGIEEYVDWICSENCD